MIEEKKKSLHPISEALVNVYNSLYANREVAFKLHDKQIRNIDSVVKTVNAEYFGFVRFNTQKDRASAYFCLIIKTHPVTDGNKRLAVLWLEVFCRAVGLTIKLPDNITLDQLAVGVEMEKKMDNDILVKTIRDLLF